MKNLVKQANWYNPRLAVNEKGNGYELDNIIIYCENGIIFETGKGWFEGHDEDMDIGKITKRNATKFDKKENFIIKCKNDWKEDRYILYVYYKNLDIKFKKYKITSFLEAVYEIEGKEESEVIGYTDRKSTSIKYSKKLEEAYKTINTYNFDNHFDEIEKAIKTIRKAKKELDKAKEEERQYTIKDYKKMIVNDDKMQHFNNTNALYNIDIDNI